MSRRRPKRTEKPRRYRSGQATRIYIKRVPPGAQQKRPVCIISGKTCFDTEGACWQWIKQLGEADRCVPYLCTDCMKHHMTSDPDTVARRWREWRRERDF